MSLPDEEERETHESYGLVSFSRRQGHPGRLFGSHLNDHGSYICLSVRKAERIHSSLGYDRYYGSMRGDLIEVDLSAAQFAELLTTMNVSTGVPCTVRSLNGKRMEPPPETASETEKIQIGFEKQMKTVAEEFKRGRERVEQILADKKSLSKDDRKSIVDLLSQLEQHLASNVPFTLKMFEEATTKVVTHAKAEIDAFVTMNVIAEGLRAIADKGVAVPQLESGSGKKEP